MDTNSKQKLHDILYEPTQPLYVPILFVGDSDNYTGRHRKPSVLDTQRVLTATVIFLVAGLMVMGLPVMATAAAAAPTDTTGHNVALPYLGSRITIAGNNTPPSLVAPPVVTVATVAHDLPTARVYQPSPRVDVMPSGWTHPLPGRCVTSPFGWRNGRVHNGTDLSTPVGTNVYAAHDGTVHYGNDPDGAGWYIALDHGNNVWTMYFHLSDRLASDGQWVSAGTHIAESGGERGAPGAGNSGGPHLHFEVHPWGEWTKRYNNNLGTNAYTDPVPFMQDRGIWLGCGDPPPDMPSPSPSATVASSPEPVPIPTQTAEPTPSGEPTTTPTPEPSTTPTAGTDEPSTEPTSTPTPTPTSTEGGAT